MATISQIEKQLASADKKISAFEKRIAMYRVRVDKAIAALNKQGASITLSDVILVEQRNGRYVTREFCLPQEVVRSYAFDLTFRVTSNRGYLDEAERGLERERAHRDALSRQLEKMKADADSNEISTHGLMESLERAMASFRTVWFERMREWYAAHFNSIQSLLPTAKDKYNRAKITMDYFAERRGYITFRSSRYYSVLNCIRENASKVIKDESAGLDYDSYMSKRESELVDSWNQGIKVLAGKCHGFGLNESSIQVASPVMTSKGFSAFITDGGPRVVDVRVIWAAEFSELVTPHTRYIATQRSV